MPILLLPPAHDPRGPDGDGWNRLRVDVMEPGPQCALRPRSYATLREAQDTRLARWGSFGPCTSRGGCDSCPLATATTQLESFTDRVLVREDHHHPERVWLMNRPEEGWASDGHPVTWEWMAQLDGWRLGPAHHDEHGSGFWLERC